MCSIALEWLGELGINQTSRCLYTIGSSRLLDTLSVLRDRPLSLIEVFSCATALNAVCDRHSSLTEVSFCVDILNGRSSSSCEMWGQQPCALNAESTTSHLKCMVIDLRLFGSLG